MKKYALIVAGGAGTRMKTDLPKQFLLLNNKPVLMHTVDQFYNYGNEIEIIIVLPKYQIDFWKGLCSKHSFTILHKIIEGGKSRFDSVQNGLQQVPDNCLVAIHDGVRPLITSGVIHNSFKEAEKEGSAIAAVALKDSIRKKEGDATISKNRNDYFLVQTPQTFQSNLIKAAYSSSESNRAFTDDASVFEASGREVTLIEGDYRNIKITTPEDLLVAQALQEKD